MLAKHPGGEVPSRPVLLGDVSLAMQAILDGVHVPSQLLVESAKYSQHNKCLSAPEIAVVFQLTRQSPRRGYPWPTHFDSQAMAYDRKRITISCHVCRIVSEE